MLTKNFSLSEFVSSSVATNHKIDNFLVSGRRKDDYIIANLRTLCIKLLQPARDNFNNPIIVTSGYRCARLNELVGGVSNSDHLFGYAADIKSHDNWRLFNILIKLPHHQIYIDKRSGFIHTSFRRDSVNKQQHWVK